MKALLADERGTASLEAVAFLPVMALCWAGIFFYLAGFSAQIDAGSEARRQAWTVSGTGCEGGEYESKMEDNAQAAGWIDGLDEVPFLGPLIGSVFGSAVTVRTSKDWTAPALLGGATRPARYGYHIMCNEKATDVGAILTGAVCDQLPDFCGG